MYQCKCNWLDKRNVVCLGSIPLAALRSEHQFLTEHSLSPNQIFIRVSEVAFCKKKSPIFYPSRPEAFEKNISNFIQTCHEGFLYFPGSADSIGGVFSECYNASPTHCPSFCPVKSLSPTKFGNIFSHHWPTKTKFSMFCHSDYASVDNSSDFLHFQRSNLTQKKKNT